MEKIPNFRSIEEIDRLFEDYAVREEIDPDDALSDLMTFAEIAKEDEDAAVYLEALAEELGISVEEVIYYVAQKAKELEND